MQGLAADTKACGAPLNCHFYGDCNYTKLGWDVQYISNIFQKIFIMNMGARSW